MFKEEDLVFTTTLADHQNVSSRVPQEPQGFYVLHKPSGVDVKITHHKSVHKNKAEAMVVLKDLLEPVNLSGDHYGNNVHTVHYLYNKDPIIQETVLCERLIVDSLDIGFDICRTPECARYLARENIKKTLAELEKERYNLTKQLKRLY